MAEQIVNIYTDGACSGNPGPGGWGVVFEYQQQVKELSGCEKCTTNNRMELTAAIKAMETLTRPSSVKLHTDSRYVMDGITQWLPKWINKGWMTAGKTPVKNQDLWQQLVEVTQSHNVEWIWVRGHAGHEGNERADFLARNAIIGAMVEIEAVENI